MSQIQPYGDVGSGLDPLNRELSTGQWSAILNRSAEASLYVEMSSAQQDASIPRSEVARRIGVTTEELEDIMAGEADLTMTELRLLAVASEAVVTFRVRSVSSTWRDAQSKFDDLLRAEYSQHAGHGEPAIGVFRTAMDSARKGK